MAYERMDLAQYVDIPIWYGCNNDCVLCMLSGLKQKLPPVDFTSFQQVVNEIVAKGRYRNLILSGAEVTTFDALEQYLQYARSLEWFDKIQLQTNGRKLEDPAYLDRLVASGANEFFISVHGLESVHDAITRIPGSFSQTLRGIRNLAGHDVNVVTNTVLTRANYGEITETLDFLSKETISELHMWNFCPMGADKRDLLVSIPDIVALLPEVEEAVRPAGKALVLKHFPLCLPVTEPVIIDNHVPLLLIHDIFWRKFSDNRFGQCVHRQACRTTNCVGLSKAYIEKYGDEWELLSPFPLHGAKPPHKGADTGGFAMAYHSDSFELNTTQDRFFDFCLWEYKPLVPFDGKFSPVNLLLHSFATMGADKSLFKLVDTIRQGFGYSRTVWGVKQVADQVSWEFYFYDYRRRERQRSIARLLEIIQPLATCNVAVNENFPYFMFSIDVDNSLTSGERELDEIHLYIGNPGSTVSSGICYSMRKERTQLENFYFFFDAQKQAKAILSKFTCSAHFDATRINSDYVIWPELKNCKVIVIANKQASDAIYFSGINVDQLIFFLNRMNYNKELIAYVDKNRSMFNHLQYDVGFDYRIEGDALTILKSAYYGVF